MTISLSQWLNGGRQSVRKTPDRAHDGGASRTGGWLLARPSEQRLPAGEDNTISTSSSRCTEIAEVETLMVDGASPLTSKESRNSNRRGNGHVYGSNDASQHHTLKHSHLAL